MQGVTCTQGKFLCACVPPMALHQASCHPCASPSHHMPAPSPHQSYHVLQPHRSDQGDGGCSGWLPHRSWCTPQQSFWRVRWDHPGSEQEHAVLHQLPSAFQAHRQARKELLWVQHLPIITTCTSRLTPTSESRNVADQASLPLARLRLTRGSDEPRGCTSSRSTPKRLPDRRLD